MEEHQINHDTTALMQTMKAIHVTYVTQQIALLNALEERFGTEVAQIVEQANAEKICQAYLANIPKERRSLDDFLTLLWEPLRQHGYEFTAERSEHGVQITCTVCPWAKLYTQLGGAEWGYRLYCAVDATLVEQFNPNITFMRTKTLMEGHDCCDHAYALQA